MSSTLLSRVQHYGLMTVIVGACFFVLIRSSQAQSPDEQAIFLPLITNYYSPAWQWAPATVVDLTPAPNKTPQLLIDKAGQPHIFWDTNRTPRFIYHTYWTGESWTAPAPIAQSLGTSTLLQAPIVDQNGTIHMAWRNDLGSSVENRYRLLYNTFANGTWGTEQALFRNTYGGIDGMLHLDVDGVLHLTFSYSNFSRAKYYQLTQTQSEWQSSPVIDPPNTHAFSMAAWAPDQQAAVRFFSDALNGGLYRSYWQDGQFLSKEAEFQGELWGHSILIDNEGHLHSLWVDQVPVPGDTVRGVYHHCLDPQLQWRSQVILSGQSAATGLVATPSSTRSQIVISWRESATQQGWLAIWQGCTQVEKIALNLTKESGETLYTQTLSHEPPKACILTQRSYPVQYKMYCADLLR